MRNQPYVKEYKNGIVTNPIVGSFLHSLPNRAQRRNKPTRFRGNNKAFNLTLVKTKRYKRVLQIVKDKTEEGLEFLKEMGKWKYKSIEHYLPC